MNVPDRVDIQLCYHEVSKVPAKYFLKALYPVEYAGFDEICLGLLNKLRETNGF